MLVGEGGGITTTVRMSDCLDAQARTAELNLLAIVSAPLPAHLRTRYSWAE